MKKLIHFYYREDFGHEWNVQILNIRGWSFLQLSVGWNDYAGWPYLQFSMGSNGLLNFLSWVHRFGLDVSVLSRTWKADYRDETFDDLSDE
jgi:hypothetical protein